jgi:iron(III) transport system ATP-binding protein
MSSLALNNIHYHYDGLNIIKDLDLVVEKNEIVCLLGASGCGKTTILKAVAGLIKPQQGTVHIQNRCMSDANTFIQPQYRNIGMMFQDYALFPHLTVAQNIAFGLHKLTSKEKTVRVAQMLELVQLEQFLHRYPHELSGGQQQRVAIARALAYKPSLLLLDEPFSNIDAQVRFSLINDIRAIIKEQQVSAIFVSHSKEEAFAFSDKLAIMHSGQIEQLGSAKTLFQKPKSKIVAQFLGAGIYLNAQPVHSKNAVKTEFGEVISATEIHNKNRKGSIYVRPQFIELTNDVKGKVEILNKRFLGTEYVYRIAVNGQHLEVPISAEESINPELPVSLKVKPHAVNFFSE